MASSNAVSTCKMGEICFTRTLFNVVSFSPRCSRAHTVAFFPHSDRSGYFLGKRGWDGVDCPWDLHDGHGIECTRLRSGLQNKKFFELSRAFMCFLLIFISALELFFAELFCVCYWTASARFTSELPPSDLIQDIILTPIRDWSQSN